MTRRAAAWNILLALVVAQLVEPVLEALVYDHQLAYDVEPERWLVWHGRGLYGRTMWACGEHRGELKALVRELYGTLGWHPWAMGPHPWRGRRGTDRARALARKLRSGFGPV